MSKAKKIKSESITNYIKKPDTNGSWTNTGSLFIYQSNNRSFTKELACFDLDGTLITTKSGNVFPKNVDDWELCNHGDINIIHKIHSQRCNFVVFTNQKGLLSKKGNINLNTFEIRIERIVKSLFPEGACVTVLAALSDDIFRKPNIGMWQYLTKIIMDGITVDIEKSFYVGDAAGREAYHFKGKKFKRDFSCADRLFALNTGLKFYTPEEYFHDLYLKIPYQLPTFDPQNFLQRNHFRPFQFDYQCEMEMIILIGSPASGKSTLVNQIIKQTNGKYAKIDMDTLKSKEKCLLKCRQILTKKTHSIIIDNTNPDRISRKLYMELAQEYNIQVRGIKMNTPYEQCLHNERFRRTLAYVHNNKLGRALTSSIKLPNNNKDNDIIVSDYISTHDDGEDSENLLLAAYNKPSVPELVFKLFKNKYEEPSMDEGFSDILEAGFVPKFNYDWEAKLYALYL